ncbi:putative membrane protein YfhO [Ruminococcaceae bacterium R-25]|nr:putative membrane protein YfhO [Ruminococcaceae bacterium R-25]SUQ21904.1 Uncharacterized membrane protein YfhO [Oscillospiraceae bacterium]
MKELSSLEGKSAKKKTDKPALKNTSKSGTASDLRPLYAFLATLVLYVAAMLLCNKYPLGEYSFLQSDLKAQYAPFLALFRSKLTEIGTVPQGHLLSYISYSFKLGLGKNFLGTFGYYLASPFNLIYLLIDESQIDVAVLTIVILKLSLASCFMCKFLGSRTDDRKTLWPVLLGVMYAFSLYSQVYIFQIMWLDGFMLLPLILYFTEKFIKKQNYLGLVISLLVLFISNYYIAYMAGIACFLYLMIRLFAEKIQLKKAVCILVRYALAAGFTALITAVLLVPVGLDTIRNADQTVSSRGSDVLTFSPLTFLHLVIIGDPRDFSDVLPCNFPFLFICLPVTLLLLLYFISPVFKGRERKIHAFCVLGAVLSTLVYPIDKAWQVFDDPNWFWHRHAFVFLPLFLIISMKVLFKIKELARKDIIKSVLVIYAFVIIAYTFGDMKGHSDAVVYNVLLATAYGLFIMGHGVENWHEQLKDMPKLLSPLMSLVVVFELIFAGPMLNNGIETMTLFGGSAEEYSDSIVTEQEFGKYAKARGNITGAFRAEKERVSDYTTKFFVEEGEAFYGNYNGLSFFNSNSNKKMQRFIKQLGMPTNYNYFAVGHSFACPSIDGFFSIGSISTRRDLSFYRMEAKDPENTELYFYANDDVLPLAFAADNGAMAFDFYKLEKDAKEKNYYAFQNEWYRSMFPEAFSEDFFKDIDADVTGEPKITNGVAFNLNNYMTREEFLNKENPDEKKDESKGSVDPLGLEYSVEDELKDNITTLQRTNEKLPIAIEYEFKAPSTDEIYGSIVSGRILDYTEVYVNGIRITDFSSNTYYSQIFRIGSFAEGETVKVSFLCKDSSWSYLNVRFATFDYASFCEQFAKIDRTKVSADLVSDGYAKFSVKNVDPDETIITTIPAEDGWQLYIDGQPASYKVYQNAFIAFDAPSGDHTAELVFTAPGLKAGAIVSCAGIVLLAAFVFIDKKLSKMKEKQDKN